LATIVSTHVASSTLDERDPAIWGRLTLTTEVSSTSITALDITARAMIQRWPSETIGDAEDADVTEGAE
jgi:hypothetical protein